MLRLICTSVILVTDYIRNTIYIELIIFCFRILNNEEWYRNIDSIRFVSEIGRHFRMGTMLLKQSVQNRINSDIGMSFTEFSYQIFQSYDWLHLLNKYNCKFQVIFFFLSFYSTSMSCVLFNICT